MSKKVIVNSVSYEFNGSRMFNDDGVWQENPDGTYTEAVPMPLYGLKKECLCGRSFWRISSYEKHYRETHTDSKQYKRTPKGLVEL